MNWTKEADVIEKATRKAGEAVRQLAKEGFETAHKANQSPVTTADLLANTILKEALLTAFPTDGWLSEETRDHPERLGRSRVWIIDPIDGTKEYVTGLPEYAVSVALVEEGLPVAGAIFNPAVDEFYLAIKGQGAWLNGQPTRCRESQSAKPALLASRSEIKRGEFVPFEPLAEVVPMGSIAYKLAALAGGKADTTFSLGPKNEWDIAAGVLIIQEAGGFCSDQDFQPFQFNQPNTLVNGIVGCSQDALAITREWLALYGAEIAESRRRKGV